MDLTSRVVSRLSTKFPLDDLEYIQDVMNEESQRYYIHEKISSHETNEQILEKFLTVKRISNLSENTLKIYRSVITKSLKQIGKPIIDIVEQDIIDFFSARKELNLSDSYLNSTRAYLSSFFSYCENQGYLDNPMKNITKMKMKKVIRPAFSDDDMYALRKACKDKRDAAVLEFLYSSGARVSECINIDKADVDFQSKTIKIEGKGSKERIIYFSSTAKSLLLEYLEERTDNHPALFVRKIKPYKRLTIDAIEKILKDMGQRANIENVHPHRFRRTLATNLLNKGMNIEEVKTILGHSKLDTTMIYCNVNQNSVKHNYTKLINI